MLAGRVFISSHPMVRTGVPAFPGCREEIPNALRIGRDRRFADRTRRPSAKATETIEPSLALRRQACRDRIERCLIHRFLDKGIIPRFDEIKIFHGWPTPRNAALKQD
jgi:hypothetical protein